MEPGGKVDAPELSLGPECEMQEVSRVGAQGVTSKSKLLAREMPDLHTGGLRADSDVATRRGHGRVCGWGGGSIEGAHMPPCDLKARCRR